MAAGAEAPAIDAPDQATDFSARHELNETDTVHRLPTPVRALETDDPAELLRFALASFGRGPVAIATLTGIRGGAARALGAHVVIAADGGHAGFVSGGCVEAAVATEAMLAMAAGRDRTVIYGEGSPFFDIVLPCGGGITVAIHVLRDVEAIDCVLRCLEARRPAALRYSPQMQALTFAPVPERAGWEGEGFLSVYRPATRLMISGRSIEAQALAQLAACAGYDILVLDPARAMETIERMADAHTAFAILHHDPDAELPVLLKALQSPGFYIGAMGSMKAHHARVERLRDQGISEAEIARIKAPIGMFGPTRDASSLAISVLADVAAARLTRFA